MGADIMKKRREKNLTGVSGLALSKRFAGRENFGSGCLGVMGRQRE